MTKIVYGFIWKALYPPSVCARPVKSNHENKTPDRSSHLRRGFDSIADGRVLAKRSGHRIGRTEGRQRGACLHIERHLRQRAFALRLQRQIRRARMVQRGLPVCEEALYEWEHAEAPAGIHWQGRRLALD